MKYHSPMTALRFQPRIIQTLERKIEQEREELQRIRNDLLYETKQNGILRRKERTYMSRIERNAESLSQLRLQNMNLRQKVQEVIS